MKHTWDKTHWIRIGVMLVICVILFALYSLRGAIFNKMDDLKLIPQPEKFTELYFEKYADLPNSISTNTPVSFSFTIHNLEGQDMNYPYNMYIKDDFGTTTVKSSSVLIKNQEYKTITESYKFKSVNSQKTLFVELPSKHQELHFKLQVSIPK